jgi:hypothetical protein
MARQPLPLRKTARRDAPDPDAPDLLATRGRVAHESRDNGDRDPPRGEGGRQQGRADVQAARRRRVEGFGEDQNPKIPLISVRSPAGLGAGG